MNQSNECGPDNQELTRQIKDLEGKIRFQENLISGWQTTTRLLQEKVAELEAERDRYLGVIHEAQSIVTAALGSELSGNPGELEVKP